MGRLPRILAIGGVWLLYVFVLSYSCSDMLCEGCNTGEVMEEAVAPLPMPTEATPAPTFEEVDGKIHIRFPFASDTPDYDPQVNRYLDGLAQRLQDTGIRLTVTGHTDNVGNDEFNMRLGMQRAEDIKAMLVRRGAPTDKITTVSRGASSPVASNDTEFGKHENRRVELDISDP